jgi:hypothetical protein
MFIDTFWVRALRGNRKFAYYGILAGIEKIQIIAQNTVFFSERRTLNRFGGQPPKGIYAHVNLTLIAADAKPIGGADVQPETGQDARRRVAGDGHVRVDA